MESTITYMTPEKGHIVYRGYLLNDLMTEYTFPEVLLLLIFGNIPGAEDIIRFEKETKAYRQLPDRFIQFLSTLPKSSPPMLVLSSAFAALPAFMHEDYRINIDEETTWNDQSIYRILASFPLIAGFSVRRYADDTVREFLQEPEDTFMASIFKWTCGITRILDGPTNRHIHLLSKCLIAHADHGQNCSTAAMTIAANARSSAYAATASAISAFAGDYYSGASQRVTPMLEQILEAGGDVQPWIERATSRNPKYRLPGFGSPVYKNLSRDPRVGLLQKEYEAFCLAEKINDPLYPIALKLIESTQHHEYFLQRGVYPNLALINGFCFRALGIPTRLQTSLIALSRVSGWLAHWRETLAEKCPAVRPSQIYN